MKFVLGIFWEILALLWYSIMSLIGSFIHYQPARILDSKKTIVIVHGFMGRSLPFIFLARFLKKAGYTVLFADFGFHVEDIHITAQKLHQWLKKEDLRKIILVGSSSGGIIILDYLQTYNSWQSIEKVICIATGFQGAIVAPIAIFFKAARQITPGSVYLKKLTENIRHKKKIISLAARYDEMVYYTSPQIAEVRTILLNQVGHGYFQLFSENMMQTLQKVIEE